MDLREYLFRKNIKIAQLAREIDYSGTHLGFIVRKKFLPSPKLARMIVRATKGEVTMEELIPPKEKIYKDKV